MSDMDDFDAFDRRIRSVQRLVIGAFIVIAILIVAMFGVYVWLGVEVFRLGPDGIAKVIGHAVKTFNDASH